MISWIRKSYCRLLSHTCQIVIAVFFKQPQAPCNDSQGQQSLVFIAKKRENHYYYYYFLTKIDQINTGSAARAPPLNPQLIIHSPAFYLLCDLPYLYQLKRKVFGKKFSTALNCSSSFNLQQRCLFTFLTS